LRIYFVVLHTVLQEAKINYGSFRELMWNLVFKAELDEMQKARWAEYISICALFMFLHFVIGVHLFIHAIFLFVFSCDM